MNGDQGSQSCRHRSWRLGAPVTTAAGHSYATSLLRRGADIHVVQRLLGHSNIATPTRYLHLSDADLTDAVDKSFPAE